MTFGEHVFLYCERGTSAALSAEPINAVSNVAFILAALMGLQLLEWRPREQQTSDHFLLIGLVALIGIGSFAFHLFATQETELLDVIPIAVFTLVYLGFALNRFLGVPPGWMVLLVIGFTILMAATSQVRCWDGGVGLPGPEVQEANPCINGSVFYLPALGALIVVGLLLEERRHRAAPYVLWAAAIFAISLTLRSLDLALCGKFLIEGQKVGTHAAWHVLNALALFLLLRASLEAGAATGTAAVTPPDEETEESRPATLAERLPSEEESATAAETEPVASAPEEAAKEDAPEERKKVFFPA
ncbi:MAG TPA: ceramidase domain-containing protein, partial [Methyloceanibacter sp.]|nr:ceramidase domain-containing protein [Methyloceanibacter sp.]